MSEEKSHPQKGDALFKGDLDFRLNPDISYWNEFQQKQSPVL